MGLTASKDVFMVDVRYQNGSIEVFQNRDAKWWLKFNSADIQARLQEGKTYRMTVTGWRVGFFSWFRNIVSATEVPSSG